jgi:hypothetical protein
MLVFKTNRKRNAFFSFDRDKKFRDDLIVFSKRTGHVVFKTNFNNPYMTYEIISIPVSDGTYKIKVISQDDLGNINSGVESTVVVDFIPLPPTNIFYVVAGSNITFTWEHSINGAPDNYIIYGNGGSGSIINRSSPLATISGTLLTQMITVANGTWKFVIESKENGIESLTLDSIDITIPTSNTVPFKPGPSGPNQNKPTNILLENVSVGKVKVSFFWLHGNNASEFNVYHDGGTGVISYASPQFSFARQLTLVQKYTTTQLNSLDVNTPYQFVVRAKSPDGIIEQNTDIYLIDVDGVAPANATDLQLDSVF